MTNREFFTAIAALDIAPELVDFANESIAKLDHKNELRKDKPSKKSLENEPIKTSILEAITASPKMTAAALANALDITTQKASSLCVQLVKEGKLTADEIKITGKGKCKAYSVC